MGKFTPLFTKDGDTYAVPSSGLLFDTPEEAVAGGAAAGLSAGYGLSATGESVELQDESNSFPGPFLIANVGNLRAWIVGGPTLDGLTAQRHEAVENLPEQEDPLDEGHDDDASTLFPSVQAVIDAVDVGGDHTGPDTVFGGGGGFDGAGAGGSI